MIKSVSYNVSALRETNFTVYALINLSASGSRNEPGWLQIDCNSFPFIFCSILSISICKCMYGWLFVCVCVYCPRLAFLPSISSSTALTRLDLTLQWPMMYREGSHWLNYKGGLRLRDEGKDEKTGEADSNELLWWRRCALTWLILQQWTDQPFCRVVKEGKIPRVCRFYLFKSVTIKLNGKEN